MVSSCKWNQKRCIILLSYSSLTWRVFSGVHSCHVSRYKNKQTNRHTHRSPFILQPLQAKYSQLYAHLQIEYIQHLTFCPQRALPWSAWMTSCNERRREWMFTAHTAGSTLHVLLASQILFHERKCYNNLTSWQTTKYASSFFLWISALFWSPQVTLSVTVNAGALYLYSDSTHPLHLTFSQQHPALLEPLDTHKYSNAACTPARNSRRDETKYMWGLSFYWGLSPLPLKVRGVIEQDPTGQWQSV